MVYGTGGRMDRTGETEGHKAGKTAGRTGKAGKRRGRGGEDGVERRDGGRRGVGGVRWGRC